jgi:predicted Rdx family selenoprotein
MMVVALLVVWGSQAQPAWLIQSVAQGPDTARQRVIEPDVAVQSYENFDIVYISYIDQAQNAIVLLAIKVWQEDGQTKTEQIAKTALAPGTGRVIGTTVAVDDVLVCVDWEELSDNSGVHEVWQACWEKPLENNKAPKYGPWQWSTPGVIAGQANGAGWEEFGFNFDNAFTPPGLPEKKLYAVWSENYDTLKAAKVVFPSPLPADLPKVQPCGDFPKLPIPEPPNRYPTIHVDKDGGVWVAVGDVSYPPGPNVWVYYSSDQCASWKGPVDMTPTGLFSDMGGIVRLGDKIYAVYDEDEGAAPGTADINVTSCDVTSDGPANCVRGIVHRDGGFPHIATDGTGLYVASYDGNANAVRFSYSCDAGGKWNPLDIPNKWNSGYRDPDFGAVLSRVKVTVDHFVYVVWFWRSQGKSNIMLGILPKPCP